MATAQVAADGSTATNVTLNADGSVTVGIAPRSADGVSLNRYDQFNVPQPGVTLDNRAQAARTIVNEVTGTGSTTIAGPLAVEGQRAHVIVANPNGITIDNGRFINTGRVALTTGAIGSVSRQVAPGIYQDNVTASVTGGTIRIEGGGLSGQMDQIDLIAHDIVINGPLTNTSTDDRAGIGLFAGASQAEFDSAVLPSNTALTWARVTGAGATSDGATLIEITRPGVLRANQIAIEVSDLGAGVRMAGDAYATARSFSLSAKGRVSVSDARIEAATGATVSGGAVSLDKTTLSATGPVRMDASGALDLTAATLRGTDMGLTTGAGLTLTESDLAATGTVSLNALGSLRVTGTSLLAFGDMLIAADDAHVAPGTSPGSIVARNGALVLTTRGTTTAGDLAVTGSTLQGATAQPGVSNAAGQAADAALVLDVAGDLSLSSGDALAILFASAGDARLTIGGDFVNTRGRLLANGDITLTTGGDLLNLTDGGAATPNVSIDTRAGARQWWTLWMRRTRETQLRYDFGILANPDRLATLTATGAMTLTAGGTLANTGGEINANGGDLAITAARVTTTGIGSGAVTLQRVCVLSCVYEGSGSVAFYGGRIMSAGNLTLDAGSALVNSGGQIYGFGEVAITADAVTLAAAEIPTLVNRPGGLYNFWSSRAAWVFLLDQYGSVIAETGRIGVSSKRPVRIVGGTLTADTVTLDAGQEVVRPPAARSSAAGHRIGWASRLTGGH